MCPDFEPIAEKLIEREAVTEFEALHFRRHLNECAECRRSFAEMQKLQHLIRHALKRGAAHPSLTDLQAQLRKAEGQWDGDQLATHLLHCQECRVTLQWLRELAVMETEFTLDLPAAVRVKLAWNGFRKRKQGVRRGALRWLSTKALIDYGYAAAAICGLALIGLSLKIDWPAAPSLSAVVNEREQHGAAPPTEIKTEDRSHQPVASLDCFRALPELEELVGIQIRSDQLVILRPRADTVRTASLEFKWQGTDTPLTFKILNNKGTVVLEEPAAAGHYLCRQPLSPGRYYWKLENSEELLWVGRFIVPNR